MIDRVQLNLRLDGRRDLLESCKEVAASQGLSLNAWVVKQLELGITTFSKVPALATTRQSLDVVDTTRQSLDVVVKPLDTMIDVGEVTELPGKLKA
jgi:hypothetical protein